MKEKLKLILILVAIAFASYPGIRYVYEDWYFPKYVDFYGIGYDKYHDGNVDTPYIYMGKDKKMYIDTSKAQLLNTNMDKSGNTATKFKSYTVPVFTIDNNGQETMQNVKVTALTNFTKDNPKIQMGYRFKTATMDKAKSFIIGINDKEKYTKEELAYIQAARFTSDKHTDDSVWLMIDPFDTSSNVQ